MNKDLCGEDIVQLNIPPNIGGTTKPSIKRAIKPHIIFPNDRPGYPLCTFHLYSQTASEVTTFHNVSLNDSYRQSLTDLDEVCESSDYVSTLRDPNDDEVESQYYTLKK